MKRRQAIQTLASAAAALPLLHVPLEAQELTSDHVFVLRDVAATVLPSAIGRKGQDEAVDNFLRWIRDYKEGVPLSHGYGEPRLVKSGPSPAPRYATQLAALQAAGNERRRDRCQSCAKQAIRSQRKGQLVLPGPHLTAGRPGHRHVW